MSKKITIPKSVGYPYATFDVNGKLYKYNSGAEVDVEDEVAEIVEDIIRNERKGGKIPAGQADYLQNDPMSASYLRNRPFYEEKKKVFSPLNLTWDGNTEGISAFFQDRLACKYYKMSDDIFTNDQIKMMEYSLNTGESFTLSSLPFGLFDGEDFVRSEGVFFARKAGTFRDIWDVPEPGVYFILTSDTGVFVKSLTSTDPIEHTETIIHKIDSKFLPDDAGNKIPFFDFKALGMPDATSLDEAIPFGMNDTQEREAAYEALIYAMDKGFIRIAFGFNGEIQKINLNCVKISDTLLIGSSMFPNPEILGNGCNINPVTVCLMAVSGGIYFIIRHEFVGSTAAITSITLKKDATGEITGGTAHLDNGGTAEITVE